MVICIAIIYPLSPFVRLVFETFSQILVTRAHREFAIATSPSTKDQRGSLSPKSPPPALEAFLEGLSEDLSPLSEGVLKTFEG